SEVRVVPESKQGIGLARVASWCAAPDEVGHRSSGKLRRLQRRLRLRRHLPTRKNRKGDNGDKTAQMAGLHGTRSAQIPGGKKRPFDASPALEKREALSRMEFPERGTGLRIQAKDLLKFQVCGFAAAAGADAGVVAGDELEP